MSYISSFSILEPLKLGPTQMMVRGISLCLLQACHHNFRHSHRLQMVHQISDGTKHFSYWSTLNQEDRLLSQIYGTDAILLFPHRSL